MLEFTTKSQVFDYLEEINAEPTEISINEIQKAGLAAHLREIEMARVGEIASGLPFVHRILRDGNELFVVSRDDQSQYSTYCSDPSASDGCGATAEISTVNVLISWGQFDSTSNQDLNSQLTDMLSLVSPGGIMIHAMPYYIEDSRSGYWLERVNILMAFADGSNCELVSEAPEQITYSTCFASGSDAAMYRLYRTSKVMKELRLNAQSVVLLFGCRKTR